MVSRAERTAVSVNMDKAVRIGSNEYREERVVSLDMMERVRYGVSCFLGDAGLLQEGESATTSSRSRASISMSADDDLHEADVCGLAYSLGCDEDEMDELGCDGYLGD
jgi:hypothetical protein